MMMENSLATPNSALLQELVSYRMPYGKHQHKLLTELPINYLEWMAREGFPKGKLGMLLETLYVIKLNGLEYLLKPIQNKTHSI